MKLIKHLANLGYGSRKEVQKLLRMGAFTDADSQAIDEDTAIAHADIRYRGKPLDPDFGVVLMLAVTVLFFLVVGPISVVLGAAAFFVPRLPGVRLP